MTVYAPSTVLAWNIAAIEAKSGHASEISPAHLLLGLCKLCDIDLERFCPRQIRNHPAQKQDFKSDIQVLQQWFDSWGLDRTQFRRQLRARVASPTPTTTHHGIMHRDRASRQVFGRAEELSTLQAIDDPIVRPYHLLQALFELPNAPWENLLMELGVYGIDNPFSDSVDWAELNPLPHDPHLVFDNDALYPETDKVATPLLDCFGRDLTELARKRQLDPVVGRQTEIRTLASILMQKRKRNAILVGEPGVGKTCIVEGLTQWLVGAQAPSTLKNKRVVEVSMASLLAGSKYRGEFEERIQALIAEASASDDTIVFIDEIHTVLGAGGVGASDAANILKPALARGEIHCIGATTVREYRQTIEKDGALDRRFQVVWVQEPTPEETQAILQGLRVQFERHHDLKIHDSALAAAVELTGRYVSDARFPDKAIDAIDRACAEARLRSGGRLRSQPQRVTHADIARVVAKHCRLPVEQITEDERSKLLRLESHLKQRVMGQDEAVAAVSDAIRTARAGLKDPRKPVGVFLFVGQTGTGKTQLAQALAEFLFDDPQKLVRIDMSEYMEPNAISRLIGAPPGYIGYEGEGQLTGAVRTHPYSVVLFDEIEKAHPQVLDLFLQILDEGRLTDSHGHQVSFRETVIVMTSNLGTNVSSPASLGFGLDAGGTQLPDDLSYRDDILKTLRQSLRPELLNRIGQIVYFSPLSSTVVRQIADKVLDGVRQRLQAQNLRLTLTEAAYEVLMEQGYDSQLGAREMERTIERLLVRPLGFAILKGQFLPGSIVRVDGGNGQLAFEAVPIRRRERSTTTTVEPQS
ncbi:MAG: ATP-dependent Clp protease ATP-binding subunit [Cyanobacteria bacterium SID2]|nr:ATP-dependent Clp protease ATP-binding subunit [Cyanobacteria bacterium SID2]MBP0002692.1 ATP-dependent Clp protease ATP-binding subunit [Cyanobacteria bacterium SBC]